MAGHNQKPEDRVSVRYSGGVVIGRVGSIPAGSLIMAHRECTDYPGNGIHIVLQVMDCKKRKEKGGAEKARIKKKKKHWRRMRRNA